MLFSYKVKTMPTHTLPLTFDLFNLEKAQSVFSNKALPPIWTPLSGGNLNYVWRWGIFPNSVIVKQTPPFIAAAPKHPFNQDRHHFERQALTFLNTPPPSLPHNPQIHLPVVLAHDAPSAVLVLSDFGPSPALGSASVQAGFDPVLGKNLGLFIKELHLSTLKNKYLLLNHNNCTVQETRFEIQYRFIGQQALTHKLPHAPEIQAAAHHLGEVFLQEGICLIMGDLWPASLLVLAQGLAVIDWELSHYGQPAQDVGHLAAHLWMLYHRNQNPHFRMRIQQFWQGFIEMYLYQNPVFDLNQQLRAIQHLGAEIMARTIGAFRSGSAYEGLSVHHPVQQEALQFATNCLLENDLSLQQMFSPFHIPYF